MKVGDLVKYHSARRPPSVIIVIGIVRQHGHQWAKGLEIGDTKQRLYDIEHCEVISASR
jgi:hypothetical protein